MAVVFDTHKQHQSLVSAGFSDPQADAVLGVATAVLDVVATKGDLDMLRSATRADFDVLNVKVESLDRRLGDLNQTMRYMLGGMVAIFVAVVGSSIATALQHAR